MRSPCWVRTGLPLGYGTCVVLLDVVTTVPGDPDAETMRALDQQGKSGQPDERALYAVTYRPTVRQNAGRLEIWKERCAVGEPLPTMPMRLSGDIFVPIGFETTYAAACRATRYLR